MFLTGDLCRRRTDGAIEFLGRIDNQVKLHGHRIELEEIDLVLQSHPLVENAAVKLIHADTSAARMAAFVTRTHLQQSETEFLHSLNRHVTEKLPLFKRPSSVTVLDQLPIGSSGKVSRRLLPDSVEQPVGEVVPTLDAAGAIPSQPLERNTAD